ncbi:MAG: urea transporter [Desulfobacterales bacterium]|nr:urea transporter [Desulfobacterales bacterium]
MFSNLKILFNSYAELFFLNGYQKGIVIFIVSLINPNVSFAGFISVLAAYLFARFIQFEKEFLKSGFYTYNALLVGLSIGYLFKVTFLTVFFVVTSSILTFIITLALNNIFYTYFKLPILSLPFVFVSSIAYLSSSKYSNLFVYNLYSHSILEVGNYLPFWLTGFFKSLGAIIFSPNEIAGAIILFLIACSSRILMMLAILGYYTGTLMSAFLKGSMPQAFADLNNFNFILIAMALGGVFLIPSIKNYVMAIIAVMISTMLIDSVNYFWSYFGIPGFTLPFNTITLFFIYSLGLVSYPTIAKSIKNTPEETLDYNLFDVKRFKGYYRNIVLPFSGRWTVWQAFDGKWTHQGSWKYAYDFIITDKDGKSYKNDGTLVEHYYAYCKPVLSPTSGRIIKVIDTLHDNRIGEVDKNDNWGNLIIIQDVRGFFVEISHLAYRSIKVKQGDWVEKGVFLGFCGNSGYSPQPHIHVQVQGTGEVGSYTLPFSFTNYLTEKTFHANNIPEVDTTIETLVSNKNLDIRMSFILDSEFKYDVIKNNEKIKDLILTVKMSLDGTYYFDSGKGKLFFGTYLGTFYFYRVEGDDYLLNMIFMAIPRLPLAYKEKIEWKDYLPLVVATKGLKKAIGQFISSFYPDISEIKCNYAYTGIDKIEGQITSKLMNMSYKTLVELDSNIGFKNICVNDICIVRQYDENI